MGRQPLEDGRRLFRALPLAVDHLGVAVAHPPVVVDPGEPQVLEGERLQHLHELVGADLVVLVFFNERSDPGGVHGATPSTSFMAPVRYPWRSRAT